MRRTVISLLPIFILTASCGGSVAGEPLHQNTGASDEGADASTEASAVADPTGRSCPSTVAAFCAQPGVECSETWAAATASNLACTEGAYDLYFFSESCAGYDVAATLYFDDVQTSFVYDDVTGALVGITSTTGTESQGGIHVVCSVGVPPPSDDVTCTGGHSCL